MSCPFCQSKAALDSSIIVYENSDNQKLVTLQDQALIDNKLGSFRHNDMCDTLGKKVYDTTNQKFIYSLPITRENWGQSIPRRTQVLYRADKSQIIGFLDIQPGSIVVESGTGSGTLSIAIISSLMPHGKLFTYEYNQQRAEIAQQEFNRLGLQSYVTIEHRDVLEQGFQHPDLEKADSIFLDLPTPWEAIQNAALVLKSGGRLCNFSPNIEQVQKTVIALEACNFYAINTIEVSLRPFLVRSASQISIQGFQGRDRLHTGYLTFAYYQYLF